MVKDEVLLKKTGLTSTINIFDLKARNVIYNFIHENPGLHFRELGRKLNIPRTTLSYHLDYLKKHDLLIEKKEGRFLRFFISQDVSNKEKTILNILRQETTRNVLLYIVVMVAASQNEIAKELELHPTTVKFHLKKLLKYDFIEPAHIKNGVIYTRYINKTTLDRKPIKNEIIYTSKIPVYDLLIKYYKKKYFNDYLYKAFLEAVQSSYPDGPPKKFKTLKDYMKTYEDVIYEIFPHPYH
jgi:DNA-binding MarR family transcriptional regulator